MNETAAGVITEIERYAIHDGTGIRTAVFFKGCPLRCRWCCNPETQKPFPEVGFTESRCVKCGRCFSACRNLKRSDDGTPFFDREICGSRGCHSLCGVQENSAPFSCARVCYYNAVNVIGKNATAGEVMDEVKRDINYYNSTNGGVTFTGGEPFYQPEFLMSLLRISAGLFLNTAVETCGAGEIEDYEKAMPLLDSVFLDVKTLDSEKCFDWIKYPLERLKKNIMVISRQADQFNVPLFIRVPFIPGFNDTMEDMDSIGAFIKSLSRVDGVEALPYHKLGRGKYRILGKKYLLEELEAPSNDLIDSFMRTLRENHKLNVVKF